MNVDRFFSQWRYGLRGTFLCRDQNTVFFTGWGTQGGSSVMLGWIGVWGHCRRIWNCQSVQTRFNVKSVSEKCMLQIYWLDSFLACSAPGFTSYFGWQAMRRITGILQMQNNISVHVYHSLSIMFRISRDCFRVWGRWGFWTLKS